MAIAIQTDKFDVGGVLLERPFKVRRLTHFGFNCVNLAENVEFYTDVLGFLKSDKGNNGTFLRCTTDHHSLALFPDNPGAREREITINQITWQVNSFREMVEAEAWFDKNNIRKLRPVNRALASNSYQLHTLDPEGQTIELNYGMAQVGWNGESKPRSMALMYAKQYSDARALPMTPEGHDVQDALNQNIDIHSGIKDVAHAGEYDVDGILLPRPFKITHVGPLRLFVRDMAAIEAFYRNVVGLIPTEEVHWQGHLCVFLRANTEHHSLALYPIALRELLDLRRDTTCMALGLQITNYRQLRDAIAFLKDHGCTIRELPSELFPGVGHSALVLDPDGHALHLYAYMEQIGWDGQPRPAGLRTKITPGDWPEFAPVESDVYDGEAFAGPIG